MYCGVSEFYGFVFNGFMIHICKYVGGYVLHYNEKESKWICNKDINAIKGCQFSYYAMQNDNQNTWKNINQNETLRTHFWDPYDLRTYPVDIKCDGAIDDTSSISPTIAPTHFPVTSVSVNTTNAPSVKPSSTQILVLQPVTVSFKYVYIQYISQTITHAYNLY